MRNKYASEENLFILGSLDRFMENSELPDMKGQSRCKKMFHPAIIDLVKLRCLLR